MAVTSGEGAVPFIVFTSVYGLTVRGAIGTIARQTILSSGTPQARNWSGAADVEGAVRGSKEVMTIRSGDTKAGSQFSAETPPR